MSVADNQGSDSKSPDSNSHQRISAEKPNDRLNESLSALADGECSELELRRLLRQLHSESDSEFNNSAELLASWNRTQLVSDLLKRPGKMHGQATLASAGFASSVSRAIEADLPHRDLASFWKPFSQTLVAASVAALALVSFQQLNYSSVSPQSSPEAPALAESTASYPAVVIPQGFELPDLQTQNVSTTQTVRLLPQPRQPQSSSESQLEVDAVQLNSYIQDALNSHFESSVEASGTVFPYVRSADIISR